MTFTIWPVVTKQFFDEDADQAQSTNDLFTKMNSLSLLVCWIPGLLVDRLKMPRMRTVSFLVFFIILVETAISFLPLIQGVPMSLNLAAFLFPIGRTLFYGVNNVVSNNNNSNC